MAKKAVLVGCNYPGTKAELKGCVNDVKRMYSCLIERFGFEEENIIVMIDTDKRSKEPTGANIRRALTNLVEGAEGGDVLFFHYSGHGVRLPAESGDKDDTGYDECIVPTDMNLITGVAGVTAIIRIGRNKQPYTFPKGVLVVEQSLFSFYSSLCSLIVYQSFAHAILSWKLLVLDH